MSPVARWWAPRAWVQGCWREAVVLDVGADGHFAAVSPDTDAPAGAHRLSGPVLPGVVNAHSHAFQRAFAGGAERREGLHDDFWSWRQRMYGVALTMSPEQLHAVATHLYRELLQGGYTQVCEFHYLHRAVAGAGSDDPLAMTEALVHAAQDAGIGLTLLPVLYERAGFAQPALRPDQVRFEADVQRLWLLRNHVRGMKLPNVRVGMAIHSLRAASPASIDELLASLQDDPGPIHIHVAEQTGEVDDCVAATGCRPIEWLLRHQRLDARWHLVHATHATPDEINGVARTGAAVVMCPGTEANLGDGLPDLPAWLAAEVAISVGSDSQVSRDWREELRWLEYGQRLILRRRNVAAHPGGGCSATAARLFNSALSAGGRAAGFERWGLQAGARADLLVLDRHDPALAFADSEHLLDTLVFSSPSRPFAKVMVAGRWVNLGD